MGNYGKSLGKDLDSMSGNKYGLESKLEENFKKSYLKLEEIIGKDLYMDMIGLIPTYRSYGGLAGAFQNIGTADGFIAEIEISNSSINKDGSINPDAVMRELSEEEILNVKEGLDMTNGILNFEDTVAISAGNQSLPPEKLKYLKENPNNKVKVKVFFNPSHGAIADVIEAGIDVVGFYLGGLIGSSNSRKLAEYIEKNPNLMKNTNAHSQGTAIVGNATKKVVLDGYGYLLKGAKINMNGSPLNMWMMKKFAEEKGMEFTYKVNKWDPVTALGLNLWNTNIPGHINYSKYQNWKKEDNRYTNEKPETNILIKNINNFTKIKVGEN